VSNGTFLEKGFLRLSDGHEEDSGLGCSWS